MVDSYGRNITSTKLGDKAEVYQAEVDEADAKMAVSCISLAAACSRRLMSCTSMAEATVLP